MTWTDAGHPLAALLAGLGGLVVGWFVPLLVARIPEPEAEPEAGRGEGAAETAPKPLYADLARLPWLAVWTSLGTGIAAAAVAASVGPELPLVFLLPMVPVCVALAYVDARTRLLPSILLLPLHGAVIVVAALVALLADDLGSLWRALVAMAVGRSIFWLLWWVRRAGMGFGDVRLVAMLAFALGYLGIAEAVTWIYAALALFAVPVVVVALVRFDRAYLKTRVPFGPALIAGALVGIACGPWVATSLGY